MGTPAARSDVGGSLKAQGWFRREGGKYVERKCECTCGKVFTQFQISARFAALMNDNAKRIFKFYSPEGFVPLYCPKCERKHLAALPPSQPT
jgi:hypothetical protein